ncbi:MAG TPA: DNA-processing protein DprA [Steroidobacteraceae bacterium]|jgi:DNA processing protein|nr:DNA-processing protein DprA [Steroidobacteraceae bacterium]
METSRARAVLARTPALDAGQLRELLAAAGGEPERALGARVTQRLELPSAAQQFLASPDEAAVDADLAWLTSSGAHIVLASDPEYPPLLQQMPGAPAALYVEGTVAALSSAQIAMVGSRNPTPAGRSTAREFATYFAGVGLTVTSGLALGIDAASHEGALAGGGATIAVYATGLDRVYPAEHGSLAQRIRACGALVSEFPPRTPPLRGHFPRRNRIIAGLSLGTLVVEAARYSGSLITARNAVEAGREVFAIPGSIHSPLSRGCHQLIKNGAKLVEEGADVLSELPFSVSKEVVTTPQPEPRKPRELDKEYEMLLDALGFEPATIDVLVARTRLPGESVASMLLILELEGRVAALPGGRYGRLP